MANVISVAWDSELGRARLQFCGRIQKSDIVVRFGKSPLNPMHKIIVVSLILVFLILVGFSATATAATAPAWTPKQANDWYNRQPWLVGSNFIPSTAINELEMWQADTF